MKPQALAKICMRIFPTAKIRNNTLQQLLNQQNVPKTLMNVTLFGTRVLQMNKWGRCKTSLGGGPNLMTGDLWRTFGSRYTYREEAETGVKLPQTKEDCQYPPEGRRSQRDYILGKIWTSKFYSSEMRINFCYLHWMIIRNLCGRRTIYCSFSIFCNSQCSVKFTIPWNFL